MRVFWVLWVVICFCLKTEGGTISYALYKAETNKKVVALTFDDGPHPKYTPIVLDILDKHQIKATFFLVGQQVEKFPEIVDRMHRSGHTIGNHSYKHHYYTKMTNDEVKVDFAETQRVIYERTESFPKYFRPPYGDINRRTNAVISPYLEHVVLWSIDCRDSKLETDSKQIVSNVMRQLHPGGIILCHDPNPRTVNAVNDLIIAIKAMGYRIVSLETLLTLAESEL